MIIPVHVPIGRVTHPMNQAEVEINKLIDDLATSQKTITDWEHGALKQIDDVMERDRLLQDLAASQTECARLRKGYEIFKTYLEENDMTYYVTNGVRRENEMYTNVCAALAAQPKETTK